MAPLEANIIFSFSPCMIMGGREYILYDTAILGVFFTSTACLFFVNKYWFRAISTGMYFPGRFLFAMIVNISNLDEPYANRFRYNPNKEKNTTDMFLVSKG